MADTAHFELDLDAAAQIVTTLAGVARIMDPEGPDGLVGGLKRYALGDAQRKLLEKPATADLINEPQQYANRLREIADVVAAQLPEGAPKPLRP